MLGGRTWQQWVGQYAESHQHPVNRFCHTVGIPLIAVSIPLLLVTFFFDRLLRPVTARWIEPG